MTAVGYEVTIDGAIGVVLTLLGVIGVLSASYAVLRTNASASTIKTLQADRDALRGRVETLEESDQDCKRQLEQVRTQNEVLAGIVTQGPAIHAMQASIDALGRDFHQGLDLLAQGVGQIADRLVPRPYRDTDKPRE